MAHATESIARALPHVPIDELLPKLDRVRQTSQDRWIASCPTSAHENGDRHPSLSIRECSDGVVLVRCHSQGCDARTIVESIGLDLRDLFPRRVADCVRARDQEISAWNGHDRPRRDRLPARDALIVLSAEAHLLLIAACDMHRGVTPDEDTLARIALAAQRIRRLKVATS